jgi:NTP pyrophosphatase (non-canonical NTP hydrolase)
MSPQENELVRKTFRTLTHRINEASAKHPKPSFAALVEEVGEVATEIQDGNNPAAYRNELIDVACVAVRLVIESYK